MGFSTVIRIPQILLTGLICIWSLGLAAQESKDTTSESRVLIENADKSINEIKDKKNRQYLKGNVRVIHDSIFMFCDSAILYENQLQAIGDVIIIQDDTIRIFSDSLYYDGDSKYAELFYGVVLENKEKKMFTERLYYDLENKFAIFPDTCLLVNRDLKLSSLRARYNVRNNTAYFYEEVTAIDGQTSFKSDSLLYDTDIDRAYFITSTYIQQEDKRIYCEEGFYDLLDKRAYFSGNPVYFSKDQLARSKHMSFSGADSLTILYGDAYVKDSVSEARAEKISLDEKTNDIILEGDASYAEADKFIEGEIISYNQETGDVRIGGEAKIEMEEGILSGDSLDYINLSDLGKVMGGAIWRDTIDNREIESDVFLYREKDEYFKAIAESRRPLVKQLVDKDTLYFSADTLISAKDSLDGTQFMEAVRYVKIFKSDLQAVCDSMFFSERDSIIFLHGSPIVWSDTTQFTADTIKLVLKDDEIKEIIASSNAFIISNEVDEYYNQIKGSYIHAYLDSNRLKKMIVRGNSESLYFIRDEEDAMLGPTRTICGHMAFYFNASDLLTVRYYAEPDSELIPIQKASADELRLKDFKWSEQLKPRRWQDVLKVSRSLAGTDVSRKPQDEYEKDVNEIIKKANAIKGGKK